VIADAPRIPARAAPVSPRGHSWVILTVVQLLQRGASGQGVPMNVDVDVQAIRRRRAARTNHPSHECPDRHAVNADIDALLVALEAARAEFHRLTESHEDLRESAELWVRLYDGSLARANAAEAALAHLHSPVSDDARAVYGTLDRIAALREELASVVRECAACARNVCDGRFEPETRGDSCARCLKALEALRSLNWER
jgi:non-ribosomal peptide synthetase component F